MSVDERRSVHGETEQQRRARRDEYRRIVHFLQSDLYEPAPGGQGNEAVWRSPLNWTVRFIVHPDRWEIQIEDPAGQQYGRLEMSPTVEELDRVLP